MILFFNISREEVNNNNDNDNEKTSLNYDQLTNTKYIFSYIFDVNLAQLYIGTLLIIECLNASTGLHSYDQCYTYQSVTQKLGWPTAKIVLSFYF